MKNVRKLPASAEDNSVTTIDVTSSAASSAASCKMPNAACAGGSVKRTSVQRKTPVHRSTPNIEAASQAEVESKRPVGQDDARVRTRSTSRSRQSTTAETNEASNRRAASSTPRSVTSRDVSRTTTAPVVRRPSTPTSSWRPATSPRQATAASSTMTRSKEMFHSTGSLTTMSLAPSSPPPKRHPSTKSSASTADTKSPPARLQPGTTDSKPVVISGRGSRAQPAAAAAAASTHDGGGKNAAIRSRISIAPKLLLPSCYQPAKTKAGIPTRSFSIDASVIASSSDVSATPVNAVATPPRIRRSVSVQERQTSPSLSARTAFDGYPEPPPEDRELNSRMEMLFEEYRKVERGLIFSNGRSSSPPNGTSNNCSSMSPRQTPTTSSKSSVSAVGQRVTAGKRVGQTIGSMRAKSVGNLASSACVSSQQQRSDRTARATPSSSRESLLSMSRTVTATSGRPSTTHQRGQSSPGIGRRSVPPPATPPPSRRTAVSDGMKASRPQQQTGQVAAAPVAAYPTDVTSPASSSIHGTRSRGVGGATRVRRDSLPSSLTEASLRLRDFSAADNSSACVDATKQSKRRPSAPSCSVTADQRAVSRPAEQVRTNSRNSGIGRSTASHESRRQTVQKVSNSNRRVSAVQQTQSAGDDRSLHSADEVAVKFPDTERRSRPSTVHARSFIPRPVSCSGRQPASRRHEERAAPMRTKPARFEPLRRFDSGVDVAAAGLSPSDDGVGDENLEAVVQQLSASLESCTLALLADNNGTSSTWQKEPSATKAVDSLDDEY